MLMLSYQTNNQNINDQRPNEDHNSYRSVGTSDATRANCHCMISEKMMGDHTTETLLELQSRRDDEEYARDQLLGG
jgi:hypothetical protein